MMTDSTEAEDQGYDYPAKLIKFYRDENGKPWLFYCEEFSHGYQTMYATLRDCGDYIGVKFRFWDAMDENVLDPQEGEISPIPLNNWDDSKPGWEGSKLQNEIYDIAHREDKTVVKVIELPFDTDKEFRIIHA